MSRYKQRTELDLLTSGGDTRFNAETETWELVDELGNPTTHAQLVAKYTEKTNRLDAVAGVYQRVNRILTNEDITVKVISNKELTTNARTDGRNIEFNSELIEDLTNESILSLHGINYHELAHIMFSPRSGSNLCIYIRENKLNRALTILEESRAEQLFIRKYPSTRLYLEASAYTYLLASHPSKWGQYFYLVTGRTYLPLELRQNILDKAILEYGVPTVSEIHSIVHEYRNLVFPADFDRAKALCHRLAKIVGYDDESKGQGESDVAGITGIGGECGLPSKGRPAGSQEQEKLQGQSLGEKVENLNTNPRSERAESGGGTGRDETQSAGEADIETTPEDTETAKAINERLEQIKRDSSVSRELRDTRRAIIDSGEAKVEISAGTSTDMAPSDGAISIARRFGTELERLVRNNDPAWLSRTRSGRLNISRTMNPDINAISEMFDQWDIGNEATDIEAVILTDNSGSMGGSMKAVCENTWIIKRGIETIEGSVTAFSFDSDTELLYDKSDKAMPRVMKFVSARGSTNPLRGIIEADRILTASKKSIKILFIVTDGDWERSEQCDEVIKGMNAKGFLTCVVFLGSYKGYRELVDKSVNGDENATNYLNSIRHNAKVFHAVSTTSDILKVATTLVKSTLKRVA